jgi:hypothetical protein
MSRSLEGLLALNLLFLVAGSCLLWGFRGWRTWGDYLWLSGVAYVCGLAAACVIGTLVLIFGGGMSTAAILLTLAGLAVAGLAIGVVRGRPLPARPSRRPLPRTPAELFCVAVALLTVVLLYEFYRVARTQPLVGWDSWAFWMPKAKAIYFFGGLDEHLFRSLPGPSYPLLVPTLAAMNFRFMASPDTTTLAVQWWLLGVGFVAASAGLLRRIAPPAVTWIFLATAVAIPDLDTRLLDRTGDWPLDIFFALAAVSLLAWFAGNERWPLVVYGLMVAAMLATKREGQLLTACLVVAALVAFGWRSRRAWLGVVGVAALAYLPSIPWRIWWSSRHLAGDAPPGGFVHATFANGSRVWPSIHLVLGLVFDYGRWLAVVPIAIAAAIACLRVRDRRPAVFFAAALVLGGLGWAWINWSDPTVPISTDPALNPTGRAVGSLVLLAVVSAPMLIGRLLGEREARTAGAHVPASAAASELEHDEAGIAVTRA